MTMKSSRWRIVIWATLLVCLIAGIVLGVLNGDLVMMQMESSTL